LDKFSINADGSGELPVTLVIKPMASLVQAGEVSLERSVVVLVRAANRQAALVTAR
jgi:hypothetical protein